jgi:outer membrane protein
MIRLFSFTLVFLIFIINISFAQKPLTLQETIDIAIKNNIEVAQTGLSAETAAVNYKQAKANLLPTVNGNITHGINQGRSIDPFTNSYANQKINYASFGLGGDIILFNGFTLQNAIKQNAFAYDASKMELQQAKDNLTLAVILAYLQVLSNEDQVELATKQIAVTQVQIDRLEKLNREGAINPPQLYDVRGQLKQAELNKVTAQNAVNSSKLLLLQLMTLPYDPSLQLEKISGEELFPKFPGSVDDVYNNATNALAIVKAAELRKKSAEAFLRLSKGTLYPILSFGGNLNTNYSSAATQEFFTNITEQPSSNYVLINGTKQPVIVPRENFNVEKISYTNQLKNNVFSNIGLNLRVPIFNSFAARNRIKLANVELKRVSLTFKNTKIQLRQEIEQAFLNMNNAWERYKILIEQVAAYNESFRAAEVRFNAGVGTSVDYTIAKDNLDRANINLVTAQYDYLLRKKILEFYNRR